MAHTPGPWVQFTDQGKTVAILPAGRPGEICSFDGERENNDANASIVAASPDMLDALQSIRAHMADLPSVLAKAIWTTCESAIAKATGNKS